MIKIMKIATSTLVPKGSVKKGKAIPVTGRGGLQSCETSRLPHHLENRLTDGGEVVKPYAPVALYPQENS
jgi:hypothetical protein